MVILPELLLILRTCCSGFPDKRAGAEAVYSMADIGLSAFALFFMQSGSFLQHQRALEDGHGRSNCQTLFGMARIPTDNHIRAMLDPVNPSHLQPCFDACLAALIDHGGLESFQRLGGRCLIALDGFVSISARRRSAARIASPANEPTAKPSAAIPCWRPHWWHPATA